MSTDWHPGRYTLDRLGAALGKHLPLLLRAPHRLLPTVGEHRLSLKTRTAVQLRLARLLGCPVCLAVFPPLAERAGHSSTSMQSALEGSPVGLSTEAHGAMAWAEEIVRGDGDEPAMIPAAAAELSQVQRAHLLQLTRLELLIHATGLMFLPHSLIERAISGR